MLLSLPARLVISPALAQGGAAPDGNPVAGRKIAAGICQSCHGMNGIAQQPEMPTIAGSDATYLVRQARGVSDR